MARKAKKKAKAKKIAKRTKKKAKRAPVKKANAKKPRKAKTGKLKKQAVAETEVTPIESKQFDVGYLIP